MAHPDDRSGDLPSKTLEEEVKRLREWHRQRNSYIEHPAQDLSKWRCYDRMPFQISPNACIQIVLWKRNTGGLEDLWLHDHYDMERNHREIYRRAAEQFGKQLEGHDCIAFWQALQAECERHVEDWKAACKKIDG